MIAVCGALAPLRTITISGTLTALRTIAVCGTLTALGTVTISGTLTTAAGGTVLARLPVRALTTLRTVTRGGTVVALGTIAVCRTLGTLGTIAVCGTLGTLGTIAVCGTLTALRAVTRGGTLRTAVVTAAGVSLAARRIRTARPGCAVIRVPALLLRGALFRAEPAVPGAAAAGLGSTLAGASVAGHKVFALRLLIERHSRIPGLFLECMAERMTNTSCSIKEPEQFVGRGPSHTVIIRPLNNGETGPPDLQTHPRTTAVSRADLYTLPDHG
jgi:hypothetical protein